MTDNTRKLLDAAAAVLGLPPGLPPIGERRRVLDEVHEVTGYDRHTNGETWVCWRSSNRSAGLAQPAEWHKWPLADAQPKPAPDAMPRVVEWVDLQPGDLALDAGEMCSDLALLRRGPGDAGTWRSTATGRHEGGLWLRRDGSPGGVKAPKAVLIARNVPKRASAIRAAYEAMRERALEVGKDIPRRGT